MRRQQVYTAKVVLHAGYSIPGMSVSGVAPCFGGFRLATITKLSRSFKEEGFMDIRAWLLSTGVLGLLMACAAPGLEAKRPDAVATRQEMVVTAHPEATRAGEDVLRRGGTAVDAMVAIQATLGLVEPQSSGLGGGAFVVYHDHETGVTITVDGRETAPAAARGDRFMRDGRPLDFSSAWQSGLSVGVPGVLRLMDYLHARYGRLPWSALFAPAMRLASDGFPLSERTSAKVAELLQKNPSCADGQRLFFRDKVAFAYFVEAERCVAKKTGTLMRNPAYAETLEVLARKGPKGFYAGSLAKAIAAAVQGDLNVPGDLTVDDLAHYRVVEREPVCFPYRGYRVCGMGPPSSGAVAVGQILGVLEKRPDLMGAGPLDVDTVHLFTQAGRLAFADRNKYLADSDFVAVPVEGLLDADYLAERASLIGRFDQATVAPGEPPGSYSPSAADGKAKTSGTSHISIIDRYGNALSMTTTIESAFGNGVMVRGFLLNNELTDFSFAAKDATGTPVANRVQPKKRPRSSMAPMIVFDGDGRVVLVTGSPGGSRIIGYTAQSIMNILDFGLDPQEAIRIPHFMNRNRTTELERPVPGVTKAYDVERMSNELRQRGHSIDITTLNSGLSIIQVVRNKEGHPALLGGADTRRDGTVGGQ